MINITLQSGAKMAQTAKNDRAYSELAETFRRDTAAFLRDSLAITSGVIASTLAANKAAELEKVGQVAKALPLRYAGLATDVLYQGSHLFVLSKNVEEMRRTIDDLNASRASLGRHVVAATDEIQKLEAEIRAWNGPEAHSADQIQALLSSGTSR
jgi:hypothetical protein